ncbi:Myoneurin [Cricetulus griseus]|uniref:Myoneurin n=1 Tax=Cricetulus griseus TaxID=10029 RepID=G3HI43_CRIGR|nr:Myoneurin [Cricetulus griseus]
MQYSHHCEHLLERLNKQREAGFLCDCTIVIGEFQFKAHRNVLASFSEYFGAIYRSTSENNVFLDQSQVKADGFQKLLEFIYTGTLNLDSWNVKEIHQAADYLKVEEVVTKCKIKMEDFAFIASPSSTEISSITGNIELNQQTCLLTLRDYNNREKSDVSTDLVQANPKQRALAKKSSQSKKKKKAFNSQKPGQNKSVQYPSDALESTSVELFLDTNKLSPPVVEQVIQGNDNSELELTSVAENTFPAQDIVQTVTVKRKRGKSQSHCALKEHSMSNIASVKSPYELETVGEELDPRYSKAKPMCNTCGKVFSEASSLRRHMRIHKGVKPYVCHLCGKAFTQCNQLKTHVRTHTGERPYKCELCDKGFAQKCQLVFHSRMHHGEEKPYKCDVCNLQFATSSNLKIHASENRLEKVPRLLCRAISLQLLYMRNTSLRGLRRSFKRLVNLRFLDLSQNHIDHFPAQICALKNLEILALDDNKVGQRNCPCMGAGMRFGNAHHGLVEHLNNGRPCQWGKRRYAAGSSSNAIDTAM